jgi:hypothetical protein
MSVSNFTINDFHTPRFRPIFTKKTQNTEGGHLHENKK